FSSLASVERVPIQQNVPNRFHAAAAFYPPCASLKGDMIVPTLILIGARDDVNPADECRKLVSGQDSWGISRQANRGIPIQLVVYPEASHAFDAPNVETSPSEPQHHFEFNQAATDQAAQELHKFLDATIGEGVQIK